MSFKHFVYYCALCGGWAAFFAWAVTEWMDLYSTERWSSNMARTALTAGMVGLLVGSTIGMLDALLNAVGFQRYLRALVCLAVGAVGGMLGGFVGQVFYSSFEQPFWKVLGWALVGIVIGASIGVYDLLRAVSASQPLSQAVRKLINGMVGGVIGGGLGGIFVVIVPRVYSSLGVSELRLENMHGPRAIGLVILGMCVGLLIGTAQVILKEAWIKVESGFRAGREMMLTKPETTIGRAEACDIGLFGDNNVEKMHARILLKGGRYLLADSGTAAGTFLNGEPVAQPTPLRSGDSIQVGRNVLRFGERQKRR